MWLRRSCRGGLKRNEPHCNHGGPLVYRWFQSIRDRKPPQLREHFPDVTFKLIDQPIEDIRGRPFIPIRAMIQAAKELSADICGIVNSDIEFRGDGSFFDLVTPGGARCSGFRQPHRRCGCRC